MLESLFHLCIYLLLVLRCPVDVIKYLEKIQRTAYGIIWWRSTTNVCCWDVVCKLIRGLGILSLKNVNSAVLSDYSSWVGFGLCGGCALWKTIIIHEYHVGTIAWLFQMLLIEFLLQFRYKVYDRRHLVLGGLLVCSCVTC